MPASTYRSIAVASQAHERVHSGAAFTGLSILEDMPRRSTHDILLRTGTKIVHLFDLIGGSRLSLFESPTVITPGEAFPYEPNNRVMSLDSEVLLEDGAVISDPGRRLIEKREANGVRARISHEWVLPPRTVYMVRGENPTWRRINLVTEIFFYVLD